MRYRNGMTILKKLAADRARFIRHSHHDSCWRCSRSRAEPTVQLLASVDDYRRDDTIARVSRRLVHGPPILLSRQIAHRETMLLVDRASPPACLRAIVQ